MTYHKGIVYMRDHSDNTGLGLSVFRQRTDEPNSYAFWDPESFRQHYFIPN